MVRAPKKTKEETYYKYVVDLVAFACTRYQPREGDDALTFGLPPWSDEELYQLTPRMVVQFMRFLAYGEVHPLPTAKPMFRRAEGLAFVKKAISFHMPNKKRQWCTQSKTGNPTKSSDVNELIEKVRLAEVRKRGKTSNAKRDMSRSEFKLSLKVLHELRRGLVK